jgi:hypothetical protein
MTPHVRTDLGHRFRASASAAVLVLLAVAGCAGQATPTIPTVASAAPTNASEAPSAASGSTDPAVAWPEYAACLRTHGVNVADPAIDAQGRPTWQNGDLVKRESTEVHKACDSVIANLPGAVGPQGPPDLATVLRFSQCIRDHGVANFPDPDADGTVTLPVGLSKEDPTLAAANKACQIVLTDSGSPVPSK